jgi:hypothetical protein
MYNNSNLQFNIFGKITPPWATATISGRMKTRRSFVWFLENNMQLSKATWLRVMFINSTALASWTLTRHSCRVLSLAIDKEKRSDRWPKQTSDVWMQICGSHSLRNKIIRSRREAGQWINRLGLDSNFGDRIVLVWCCKTIVLWSPAWSGPFVLQCGNLNFGNSARRQL